jgi:DNA-binding transcriptional LysR family regulator
MRKFVRKSLIFAISHVNFPHMDQLEWNDLQAFLAVARVGRLTMAAQRLGVEHSTLSRHLTRLETVLQTRLFDRRPTGYVLTDAGERLVTEAETIESSAIGILARIARQDTGLSGSVRIATPEGFGTFFLAPCIGQLTQRHPELEVELVANPRVVSLSKREADIAVAMARPKEGRLHARKLVDYELGLYASHAYLAAAGEITDMRGHSFVGYIDDLLPTPQHEYLRDLDAAINPKIKISNVITQMMATVGGGGLCILPCFMADHEPRLVRLLPEQVRVFRSYWLVVHSDMRELARVAATARFIANQVQAARRLFLPEPVPTDGTSGPIFQTS